MNMERMVQDVGRGMGAADRLASLGIDVGADLGVDRNGALLDSAEMEDKVVVPTRVLHAEQELLAGDRTRVADLTAGLGIECGAVEDERDRRTLDSAGPRGRRGRREPVLLQDADDAPGRGGGRVTE